MGVWTLPRPQARGTGSAPQDGLMGLVEARSVSSLPGSNLLPTLPGWEYGEGTDRYENHFQPCQIQWQLLRLLLQSSSLLYGWCDRKFLWLRNGDFCAVEGFCFCNYLSYLFCIAFMKIVRMLDCSLTSHISDGLLLAHCFCLKREWE